MKTKIYYEIQDNTGWVSDYYKADFEVSKQKVEELSMCETFKDIIYFTINKIEMYIADDEILMNRKKIAVYWTIRKTWFIDTL